jgi:hypothetical protein
MAKQPSVVHVPGIPHAPMLTMKRPEIVSPATQAPTPPPAGPVSVAKIVEALEHMMRPQHEALERLIAGLTDAIYDNAIITHAAAFAAMKQPEKKISFTTMAEANAGKRLYQNNSNETVVIFAHADNAAVDVVDMAISYGARSMVDAQMSATLDGKLSAAVVLRPAQEAWVNVRAITMPVTVTVTVIPLRGKASVFGG